MYKLEKRHTNREDFELSVRCIEKRPDEAAARMIDLEGKAIIGVPEDSKSFQKITNNIEKILEI